MINQNLNSLFGQQLDLSDLTIKQQQILKAALELFSGQGFKATTTQQIAERAGVASGSVYKKFPSKRALLAAVLTPLFQATALAADEFAAQILSKIPEEPTDFIRVIVQDRLTFAAKNAQVLKLMLSQLLTDNEFAAQIKSLFLQNLVTSIFPALEKYKSEGKILPLDNHFILQLLLSSGIGYLGRLFFDPESPKLEVEIQMISDFLIRGLCPQISTSFKTEKLKKREERRKI